MNGNLLYNYILVNRFFRYRISIISFLGKYTIKLLVLNLRLLFISINCLVLTNTIDKALLVISVVLSRGEVASTSTLNDWARYVDKISRQD